ncbi:MAG: type II secretion system F family protein [Actinobacteria bacterium]|nr:type II secretion system F family protein [Actinomycetota bacterium]
MAASLAGAAIGLALLGLGGALLGAVFAPPAVGLLLRARRARYAARIDAGAAELALALASSLSAGRSVRAALLEADTAVPHPLSTELAKVAAELTLGRTTEDALAALRDRTASDRVDALTGAIELHRRSGADLARLARELADAFRARDAAHADARSATVQARFTALIVGVIPPAAGLLAELAAPGAVSGALLFAPTALLMFVASGLMLLGALLCLRVSRV